MKFYKVFFSFSLVLLIIFSAFPISAFADDVKSYNVPYSQPQIFNNSGYAEILFERASDGYRYVRVFQWQVSLPASQSPVHVPLALTINKNGYVKFDFVSETDLTFFTVITITDPRLSTDFHFNAWQDLSSNGYVSRYLDYDDNIVSYNLYGSYSDLTSNLLNTYMPKFTVSYGDDTSLSMLYDALVDISDQLTQLHNDNVLIYDDLEYITRQLNDFSDRVAEALSLLHGDLDEVSVQLYEVLVRLNHISSQLDDFSDRMHVDLIYIFDTLEFFLQDFRSIMPYYEWIDQDLLEIIDRLDRLLEMQGNVEQTTVDNSNIDNALDIENSLLDNSNVDVSDVVNVEVNQNALTVIWDLVEKFLNSNGKVFGMVLTVLSLGLVAMILGRKV